MQWVYANPDEDCFALIYRVLRSEPPLVAMQTRLSDDRLVWTSNSSRADIALDGYTRTNLETSVLSELLQRHRVELAKLLDEQSSVCPGFEFEDAVAAGQLGLDKYQASGSFRQVGVSVLRVFALVAVAAGVMFFATAHPTGHTGGVGGGVSLTATITFAATFSAVFTLGGLRVLRYRREREAAANN
jgi:hypothetical protein